ncbi:hypothetical protein CICLE_v10013226mg [Citrus x clementina]|uniref:Uncharacterized protein n=1 Tax=Citrus clementina TaxID=85681 RepID=V4S648_CITCL|nr:hypothetical protein CICLE_v10013226mg [Citrus x clementina]
MDELCEDQGLPQVERPIYDVKSAGLCTEDEEYITKIKEFQAYLDLVQKIAKPGCSQEVLKVALNSMASLVKILNCMSSTLKLRASL